MMNSEHAYAARVVWEGNTGEGTARYTGYGREYHVEIGGKPELRGSADPAFRGDAALHNPEDLFLASISACHMLFYLALCARRGIRVTSYEDDAQGTMRVDAGGGRFEEVTLRPMVTIDGGNDVELALRIHDEAHASCFIANSCAFPIRRAPTVRTR
ncbi:OsmC family protein [Longimicrobium terrae]|nr:OsmC family protein [Longimicrobium terrae]MBB4634217.1 organic hydroperoxide reductase OsmC/OhrA [Longimicrobium terrae]